MNTWYQLEAAAVLNQLGTNANTGLSGTEASQRLLQYGKNELQEHPPKSPWLMLWEQFTATTVLVLIVAAVISALLGDFQDTAAIMAIVIFNGLLGFTQEYKAGKDFAALKKMAVPKARVWRDSEWQEVVASELVPGDIIQLEDGDQVPADARLLECINLRTQEAAFTGESESVEKSVATLTGDSLPLGDRHNMVFMGTIVTYGRGRAVVTETGMNTELGKIADSLQSVEPEATPLQRRLDQLGRRLALMALALVAVIFGFGIMRGEDLEAMFLTAVSLAVAIIPEGLPAVVTIALALGARRMLKRKALIRKLPAVETLGSVTTICSDKTGTLTENRMTVTILSLAGQRVDLRETFAEITSRLDGNKSIFQPGEGTQLPEPMALTLVGCALCNNALVPDDADDTDLATENRADSEVPKAIGDPTEIALVVAADRLGLDKEELEELLPRQAEAPFDSDRKRMTTIHRVEQDGEQWKCDNPSSRLLPRLSSLLQTPYLAFTKGSVDGLLQICTQVWIDDRTEPLTPDWDAQIRDHNDRLASSGTRVLGVAFRPVATLPLLGQEVTLERDLIFVGLVGMLDPARPEAKTAVQTCHRAGIRTVMITGDHPLMARHIAEELEISQNGCYLTGVDLDKLSLEELAQQVEAVSVYARVSPQQKLAIVEALQSRGHIVAMTGDGVNDAPALSKADIGVAMGITGTDVAKEAADMVLLNDNFATIVAAVEEGRVIYDNIRKFIRYNLTGNTSGVVIMLFSPLLAMPLPLRPTQILWINLLADGLLALALSVEPAESNVMRRPPYPPNESVFSRGVGRDIIWVGSLMGLIFLFAGDYFFGTGAEWVHWQVMVFSTLAFSRISLALAMRSEHDFVFSQGFFANKPMLAAVVLTFALQMLVIYVPWLQGMFSTQGLSAQELLICLALSTVGFWAVEAQKLFFRWRPQ
ncbi:cation-translocating P-type ATPase [Trichothermofontia sichuanensis B231]|uniref:cation-translocating P-type ATPase n=1 Tax=Trichothermofontia sichuanensis TaxID=3045816 RepID=UPI00224806FF|nr:cation-translocating P-type ATPase [Trichothermofontia sichuanensis]UZQ55582.1 cation-translocating P-type ATPase [Trichothermofontia sichuanensis B231]